MISYNHNPKELVYVIGHSVQADEIAHMLESCCEGNVKVIHHDDILSIPPNAQCVMGFSNIVFRKKLLAQDFVRSWAWPTFVHDDALVEKTASLGKGCLVYPKTTILHKARLGDFGLVFPHSHLSHGCQIGKNVVLCPYTIIGGNTNIGDNVFFGQASSIKDKITIVDDTNFFMNSIVTKSIVESGTYYGSKRAHTEFSFI